MATFRNAARRPKYASEIRIDTDAINGAATSIDPTDMQALQNAMTAGAFATETTEAQERALEKLETQLALIEGWVETITYKLGVRICRTLISCAS